MRKQLLLVAAAALLLAASTVPVVQQAQAQLHNDDESGLGADGIIRANVMEDSFDLVGSTKNSAQQKRAEDEAAVVFTGANVMEDSVDLAGSTKNSAQQKRAEDEAAVVFTDEDLLSEEKMWEFYGRWAAHHGVVREPGRFPALKESARRVQSYKNRHPGEPMTLNKFGDMTEAEFRDATVCLVPPLLRAPPPNTSSSSESRFPVKKKFPNPNVPKRVDWRDIHAVTDVKDQGGCGACWAFSTVAAMEGMNTVISKRSTPSLSAQYLLDCTADLVDHHSGCQGGQRYNAFELIRRTGGIPWDWKYRPYVEAKYPCNTIGFNLTGYWAQSVVSFGTIPPFSVAWMKYFVSRWPISVSIGVDSEFRDWDVKKNGKIYYGPGNMTLSHAVTIVGYDVDKDTGHFYWIVKNSWGEGWGDKGFINIYGDANTGSIGKAGVAGILMNGIWMCPPPDDDCFLIK